MAGRVCMEEWEMEEKEIIVLVRKYSSRSHMLLKSWGFFCGFLDLLIQKLKN